ncbi:hypothetical protein [Cupriavidus pinatubonensis]|uniref:Uncharacterized protein n=1 Tax=Cupriavidus pinatubonensis TaxID=248026 RepID=A0ABM8W9J8_9BURK|nr:hypothetical protein [Cupriavidus pinatubonensis]CAG9163880.1 hypothetical protein LMG23994_00320 [Cupriavidus pinatubonensis]
MKTFAGAILLAVPLIASAQNTFEGVVRGLLNMPQKPDYRAQLERQAADAEDKRSAVEEAAIEKVRNGAGPHAACSQAADEHRIARDFSLKIERTCLQAVNDAYLERQQAVEQQRREEAAAREAERKEKEAAALLALERNVADIRAGRRKVGTLQEADAIYQPQNGTPLASAPKVRPDGKTYFISGTIESPDSKAPAFTAIANGSKVAYQLAQAWNHREYLYFHVRLPKEIEEIYFDQAKVGQGFTLVGKYSANVDYETVAGQKKSMPVFEALYFEFW